MVGLRVFLIVIAATHIALLANKNEPTPQQQPTESIIGCVADEIGKYKDLLDCGAITPEEYVRQREIRTQSAVYALQHKKPLCKFAKRFLRF